MPKPLNERPRYYGTLVSSHQTCPSCHAKYNQVGHDPTCKRKASQVRAAGILAALGEVPVGRIVYACAFSDEDYQIERLGPSNMPHREPQYTTWDPADVIVKMDGSLATRRKASK